MHIIKLMRKSVLSILSAFAYIFLAPLAYAQGATTNIGDVCAGVGVFKPICELGKGGNVGSVLGAFAALFFVVAAVIAVLYLIYGGVKWITSGGDKTEVENARKHIIAAITGLIVVFLAFFLINFVLGFLIKDFSINNITIPNLTGPTSTPTLTPKP